MNIIQEIPKTISSPVVVRMSGVIQPLVISSSNSSPLPSTPSLLISPLLRSPLESNIPNDFSFNTISNISSAPSDRPVHNTYVSLIKSQVSSSSGGSSRTSGRSSVKQLPGVINLERSYQICQAVLKNSPNFNQLRSLEPPPAVLIGKSSILQNGPNPIRSINITSSSQPLVVRHVIASPRDIPVTMSAGLPYTSDSSAISQGSSLKNSAGHVVPPPPLDCSGDTAPVMGNTVSFANVVPFNQCMTTMYNPMANSNMISHSNQMRQLYSQCAIDNSQLQLQQQQKQLEQEQQITTPQTQQSYNSHFEHSRMTNNQLDSQLRNVGPIVITPETEIIDLSSPPSSPILPTVQETSFCPIYRYELMRIPERNKANNRNTAAYKIQKSTFQGRIIHCINAKPYVMHSHLLVTLDDLVQILFPSCTVTRCAHILQNKLKITLFSGNSEQLALLRENRHLRSVHPENTPMALLPVIRYKWNTLQTLVMQEYQNVNKSAGGPSKRHCTR